MPRNSNKYIGNCSVRGVANKFKQLEYMTDIPHKISTGNKVADKYIANYATKVINLMVRDPRLKAAVRATGKVYPYIETGGANIARAVATYKETCKTRK